MGRNFVFYARFIVFSLVSVATLARPTFEKQAIVTSANTDATLAGVKILKMGGNAVDAAVATALAISVVEPFSAGLGGGGFALIYLNRDKKVLALDFREVAPQLASATMFEKNSSVNGPHAVAVPGTVAGLLEAHHLYGKLPWRKLFEPAIALAKNGFVVEAKFFEAFASRADELKKHDASWRAFTRGGKAYSVGEKLKQPDLAKTLEILSRKPQAFYAGSIAKAIVTEMRAQNGVLSDADLKDYRTKWREPLCGAFLESQICSMPPPSSGGIVLLQMLNAVQEIGPAKLPWHAPSTIDSLAKIMKLSFHDRAQLLGDPGFVDIPVAKLISREYMREKLKEATLPAQSQRESSETTHLNAVDSQRNAVSLTFTVNLGFGSAIVVPKTGILLNNEMDDFASAPNKPNAFGLVGSEANAVAPKKIPLSSMTPIVALKDGNLQFVLGAPGGSRIITTVFHTILNHMVYGMNIQDAISSRRFHHQWMPDEISVEENGLDPASIDELVKMGNKVKVGKTWSNANMIEVLPQGGLEGAADPRGHGYVSGY